MRRTSATTLAQHDHHHQQQSTAKARTSLIIVALLSGSLQYYYYCNHYCINISIALLFFHCGPKRMSGISISFLYCWYHYTNSHFVCIIVILVWGAWGSRSGRNPETSVRRPKPAKKNPHSRINSFRIQIACSNFNFWGPLGQVAISISKKYTCRWVLPKVEKPILRWDPGGAQKKWSKCPRLERPILRWDLGGAKLITALNFMLLHHVFHRNVQLYFQRRGCSNQAANMRLRYGKEQISILNPL